MAKAKLKEIAPMDDYEDAPESVEAQSFGIFTWGGVEHNLDALTHEQRTKVLQHGIANIQGNGVSAKMTTWSKKFAKDNDREPSEAETEAQTLAYREANWSRLLDGTYGLHGPRAARESVLEDIALELARADAYAKLHTARLANKDKEGKPAPLPSLWPVGTRARKGSGLKGISGEEATVSFDGVPMTRAQIARKLFERNLDAYATRARIEHEARKAERETKANLISTNVATGSLDDIL